MRYYSAQNLSFISQYTSRQMSQNEWQWQIHQIWGSMYILTSKVHNWMLNYKHRLVGQLSLKIMKIRLGVNAVGKFCRTRSSHINMHTHTHMHEHITTHMHTHIHTDACMYEHIYTYVFTHTHTHTHTHTCWVCTQNLGLCTVLILCNTANL